MALTEEEKIKARAILQGFKSNSLEQPDSSGQSMSWDDFDKKSAQGIAKQRNLEAANTPKKEDGFFTKAAKSVGNFGVGVVKGIAELPVEAARAGSSIADWAGETKIGQKAGEGIRATLGKVVKPETAQALKEGIAEGTMQAEERLAPKGTAQKAGKVVEDVAEFITPMGLEKTALKGVSILDKWKKIPRVAKTTADITAKASAEALGAGGVTFVQTGGDIEEAKDVAKTAGIMRGALGAAGSALRSAKIPERMYSRYFKVNQQSVLDDIKSRGLENFSKTEPERFQELVKEGVIKVGDDGSVLMNETLARKALDKGLQGSIKNMANTVVKDLTESEAAVRNIAKNSKELIKLPPKGGYESVLTDIAKDYQNVAGNEISVKALKLAEKARSGQMTAIDAIELRRFLDDMRIRASYNPSPSGKLSLGQQNLKYLTDKLRGEINAIPGMKDVMEDYSFNIEALESLAKEAKRRNDKAALGMFDNFLLSGGIISGEPATAVGVNIAKRLATAPRAMTKAAQAIDKGTSTPFGKSIRGGTSQYLSQLQED